MNVRSRIERIYPNFSYINFYKDLESYATLSTAEKKELQLQRVHRLLIHAETAVPYYKMLFQNINFSARQFSSIADLRKIPLLTKPILQAQSKEIMARNCDFGRLIERKTSGSTGMPLKLWFSLKEIGCQGAIVKWQYGLAGVDPREKHIVIAKAFNRDVFRYESPVLFVNTAFTDQRSIASVVQRIRQQQQFRFIRGYPSYLKLLAEEILKTRIVIRHIKAVITGYECLVPEHQQLIAAAFSCPVYNFYGLVEGCAHGFGAADGTMVLDTCASVVELHSSKQESQSEFRQLVATSLINYSMPLIRYVTGDCVKTSANDDFPVEVKIDELLGRHDDLIVLKDGSTYNFRSLAKILQDIEGLRSGQFIYKREQLITLAFCGDVSHSGLKRLKKRLNFTFRKKIAWKINKVNEPMRSGSKPRFVIVCD